MNTHYLNGLPQEWTAIAEVFSALGDGTRQTILLLFEPGESIELKTFVDILPLSRSAVVHHLKVCLLYTSCLWPIASTPTRIPK